MTNARLDELKARFQENPRRFFAPYANELRKSGDSAQAITICRTHLASQPSHVSGHIVLGQALQEAGEMADARQAFTAALALDPENLIALRSMGEICYANGELVDARHWYERLLDADPRNSEIAQLISDLTDTPTPAGRVDVIPADEAQAPESVDRVGKPPLLSHAHVDDMAPIDLEAPEAESPSAESSAPGFVSDMDTFAGAGLAGESDLAAAPEPIELANPVEEMTRAGNDSGMDDTMASEDMDSLLSTESAAPFEFEDTGIESAAASAGMANDAPDAEMVAEAIEFEATSEVMNLEFDAGAEAEAEGLEASSPYSSAGHDESDEVTELELGTDWSSYEQEAVSLEMEAGFEESEVEVGAESSSGAEIDPMTTAFPDEAGLPEAEGFDTPADEMPDERLVMEASDAATMIEAHNESIVIDVGVEADVLSAQQPDEPAAEAPADPIEATSPPFSGADGSTEELAEAPTGAMTADGTDLPTDELDAPSAGDEPPHAVFAEHGFEGSALAEQVNWQPTPGAAGQSDPEAAPEWFDEPEPAGSGMELPADAGAEAGDDAPARGIEPPMAEAGPVAGSVEDDWFAADSSAQAESERADEPWFDEPAAAGATAADSEDLYMAPELVPVTSSGPVEEDEPEPAQAALPYESQIRAEADEEQAASAVTPTMVPQVPSREEFPGHVGYTPMYSAAVGSEPPAPAPFVTETLAELYVQQGFHSEALAIYRQLAERDPSDEALQRRIAELELAGASGAAEKPESAATETHMKSQSVRAFFASLARRSPSMASVEARMARQAGDSAAPGSPQGESSFAAAASALATLFPAANPGPQDEGAASTLAGAYTEPVPGGRPSRAAERELSLDHLFRDVPAGGTSGVKLDEFYAPRSDSSGQAASPDEEAGAPDEGEADIRQFTAWLEGLRKK